MDRKTNIGLVEYAKEQVKHNYGYWYGCFGQRADKNLLAYKRQQYPSQYPPKKWTMESFTCQYGQRVTDCVGLIKGYMFSKTPESEPVYNAKYDLSADSLIKICTDVVPYKDRKEIGGLICWKKGHVGVYALDGKTEEAKGHAYGCIETSNTAWQKVGKLPWIIYVDYGVYVMGLYEDVLDRVADKGGLDYWTNALRTKTKTINDVAMAFFSSEEFYNRNLTNAEFVKCLYSTFFGREPDKEGFAYWMNELKKKSRMQIVGIFISSPEWVEKSRYIIPE